ncbi:unnamed protein product [Amaranthus hypochondriacus]
MEFTSYIFLLPLILPLIYLLKSNYFTKSQNNNIPPTPSTWCFPIIGHLHLLKQPYHKTLAHLATRHGPILSLRFGSYPVLLVSSPSAAEECLAKNDLIFATRPNAFLTVKHLAYDSTTLSWAPYGPNWRNLRRIVNIELFSSHRLQTLDGIRSSEVKLIIRQLCGPSSTSKIVTMRPLFYEVAMNIMCVMIFGKRFYGVEGEEAERFREMVRELACFLTDSFIGDLIPCLRWLDWLKMRRLRKIKEEKRVIMRELMAEHREAIKEEDGGDCDKVVKSPPLAQVLLRLQKQEPEYYNDDFVFGLIEDLLVGSLDSTAIAMEWALSLLLNHPDILNKAKIEIQNEVGFERLVKDSDLNHLPYLGSIINETLRMYPPGPISLPHESTQDCIIGGYHIPKGTMLQMNLWAIQNDPQIWEDPTSFRPERFEGNKIGNKVMAFGLGRRSCPAEGLALRVMGLTLAALIQCFELERVDHMLVDLTEAPEFVLMKVHPLRLLIRPYPITINLLD